MKILGAIGISFVAFSRLAESMEALPKAPDSLEN